MRTKRNRSRGKRNCGRDKVRERKQASVDHGAGGGFIKRQREGAGTQRGGTKRQKKETAQEGKETAAEIR
jgi:hypothetical protein